MVGLGSRFTILQEQMKKTPCERCHLLYNHTVKETCPHCGNLDEAGLQLMLVKRAKGFEKRKLAAKWFFSAALIIIFLLVLINI